MRTYIAGPMRGRPLYNFPAFDAMRNRLHSVGMTPVSPADLDREAGFNPLSMPDDWDWSKLPDHFNLDEAIDRDMQAIKTCDAIVMLEGWEQSKGARAELAVAEWMGLERLSRDTLIPMEQENIADEAQRLVGTDRNNHYGHPLDDFSRTACIWNGVLHDLLKPGASIPPERVALCMVGVKLSREVNHPKRDNRVDGIGYWLTADMVHRERADREEQGAA